MDYLTPDHPFFSVNNIVKILGLVDACIEKTTGQKVTFRADEEFDAQMYAAATQYPDLLIQSSPDNLNRLNDIIVRRAVDALTVGEDAGMFIEDHKLYKQTRRVRRGDDGVRDPNRQNAGNILAGNVYKSLNDDLKVAVAEAQKEYLDEAAAAKFAGTRPTLYEDTKFRNL